MSFSHAYQAFWVLVRSLLLINSVTSQGSPSSSRTSSSSSSASSAPAVSSSAFWSRYPKFQYPDYIMGPNYPLVSPNDTIRAPWTSVFGFDGTATLQIQGWTRGNPTIHAVSFSGIRSIILPPISLVALLASMPRLARSSTYGRLSIRRPEAISGHLRKAVVLRSDSRSGWRDAFFLWAS